MRALGIRGSVATVPTAAARKGLEVCQWESARCDVTDIDCGFKILQREAIGADYTSTDK